MMKRIVSLALALLMALLLLPAQAEAAVPEALYRIVHRTEAGDRTLGTAVLFGSRTTLLTAGSCWAEGGLFAIGADGEHAIVSRETAADTQLILLELAEESAAAPLTSTMADRLMSSSLIGATADGSFTSQEMIMSRATVIDGRTEVLLSAGEGLLPGAIMLGADGGVACITVWQQGEGAGAYAAVANVTLAGLVNGAGMTAQRTDGIVYGFTAMVEGGEIIVDWTDAQGYTMTENALFTVYITVDSNPYLSYNEVSGGATKTAFPAIPGTEAAIWISVTEGPRQEIAYPEYADDIVFVSTPEAEPFTAYGFQNIRCGVTPGEEGKNGWTEGFLPQQPLTRKAISQRANPIYFQTEDVYTVAELDEDHVLVVALYTPEGYIFSYQSSYIFSPDLSGSDLWVSDITELFEDYDMFVPEEMRWPAGEYAVVYYIDGGEVARVPFTLD